jgi:hypothetical protein
MEGPPTPDQVRTIVSYLRNSESNSVSALLSAHPSAGDVNAHPATPEDLVRLVKRTPMALKWPIAVDWHSGRAAAGSVEGVVELLEHLRKIRDGEA